MFLYKFGYGSYEESDFKELIHENQYTEEEFDAIITKAIIKVLKGVISGNYKHIYIHNDGISYQEIHEYVIDELKQLGFKEVNYQAEWSCFGWPSIVDQQSWSKQRGEKLNSLFWKIPEDIRNQIKQMGKEKARNRNQEYDIRYREVLCKK